jgi:hypothetical protein
MMTRNLLRIATSLLLTCCAWAGPEEDFAGVVGKIQQADRLIEEGKDRAAIEEYRKAHESLIEFRRIYPDWDTQVVSFRMRYLNDRLEKWAEPEPDAAPATDAELQALRTRIGFLERSAQQYQAQINQLLSENHRLSGRLREALAIRPAATDPALLAETRLNLEDAEAETARLKEQLETLRSDLAAIPKADEARQNSKLLEEARKNLNWALADAETLRKENAALREAAARPATQSAGTTQPAAGEASTTDNGSQLEQELVGLRSENELLRLQLAAAKNSATSSEPSRGGPLGRVDRARMALASDQPQEAIELLAEVLAGNEDHVEAWYLTGRACLADDDSFRPACTRPRTNPANLLVSRAD